MPRFFNKRPFHSALVLMSAFGLALFGFGAPAQAATSPSDTINQSIVFVQTVYPASVAVPMADATVKTINLTNQEVVGRCSGSVISTTGHILTAAHCIQTDSTTADWARQAAAQVLIDNGYDLGTNLKDYIGTWTVTFGTPSVYVLQPQNMQQPAFVRGLQQVRVITAQTPETGDLALLQLSNATGTIPLTLAAAKPAVGEEIVSIGFPALTDSETTPQLQDPTHKPLTITRYATTASTATPVLEVDGELLGGMSGGPAINASGQVIGVNSRGYAGRSVSYITDTDDLNSFLRANSIAAQPAPLPSTNATDTPSTTDAPMPPLNNATADKGGASVPMAIGVALGILALGGAGFYFWPKLRARGNKPSKHGAVGPKNQNKEE